MGVRAISGGKKTSALSLRNIGLFCLGIGNVILKNLILE